MKIVEIISEEFRSDLRLALKGRAYTPLQTTGDDATFPEDDVLDIEQQNLSKQNSKKQSEKNTTSNNISKTTKGGYDLNSILATMSRISKGTKDTLMKIYDIGENNGYNVRWGPYKDQGLHIIVVTKSNNLRVTLAVSTTTNYLPDKVRIFVGSSKSNESRIKGVYTELAKRYYPNEPETFDGTREEGKKIGKKFRRDGDNPSMSMKELGATTPDEIAEKFWDIVFYLDSFGSQLIIPKAEKIQSNTSKLMPSSKKARTYYEKLTYNLIESWQLGTPWALSRGGEGGGFDRNDSLITIGFTKAGYAEFQQYGISKKKPTDDSANKTTDDPEEQALLDKKNKGAWREHVVPCDYINELGIAICEKYLKSYKLMRLEKVRDKYPEAWNNTIKEVSEMIQRNLAIVICSKKEARYIDYTVKWKTTMPPGWKDGDNILARFTECPNEDGSIGIAVYRKTGQRLAES